MKLISNKSSFHKKKILIFLVVVLFVVAFVVVYKTHYHILKARSNARRYAFFDLGANNGDSMLRFFEKNGAVPGIILKHSLLYYSQALKLS